MDLPSAGPGLRLWFASGLLGPSGRQLALWVAREPDIGAPATSDLTLSTIIALLGLDDDGAHTAIIGAYGDGDAGMSFGWSPDGQRLAVPAYSKPGGALVLVLVSGQVAPVAYPLSVIAVPEVSWSLDSRWFAYDGPGGLTIVGIGAGRSSVLDPEGHAPAWQTVPR